MPLNGSGKVSQAGREAAMSGFRRCVPSRYPRAQPKIFPDRTSSF